MYRNGSQIGTSANATTGQGRTLATFTFTPTLQTYGPGTYAQTAHHSFWSNYCQDPWRYPGRTSSASYTYGPSLAVQRPSRPDYSSSGGPVYYLGPGITYSGTYRAQTTLVPGNSNGATETPQWVFKAGSTFGSFSCTSCLQPVFTSARKGTGCLVYDVVLATSYNGFESDPFYAFINGPHSTEATYDDFGDYWKVPDVPFGNGWWTRFNYKTKSLCTTDVAMNNYDMNESFGSWTTAGSWGPPSPNGFDVGSERWTETMSFQCPAGDCTPMPLNPGPDFTSVQYAQQTWKVGSQIPGQGAAIQINTHHRYRDQGEHENIVNPAVP